MNSQGKPNGVASAEDFRSAAFEQAFEPEERVVLSESGLPVVLRRPRLIFFTLTKHPYPAELAQRIGNRLPVTDSGPRIPDPEPLTPDELKAYAAWLTEVLGAVFVKPKLSLTPGPEEIHPNWLRPGDVNFIFEWITGGIVARASQPEDSFRPSDVGGCGGGGDVSLPAVGDPPGDDPKLAN